MIPPFQLYLFDVDGTLLDSAGDICAAMRFALETEGVTGVTDLYLRKFIGYHLRELFAEALPAFTEERMPELLQRYRGHYLSRGHTETRVYPGIAETLGLLPGLKSTATTKSTETVESMLRQFGLRDYFHHVQGTDGFPSKPEPDVVLRSLEKFGIPPDQCLFIGDAAPDMEAGRRAGVRTCAVRYGYGNQQDMAAHAPDYWISSPLELLPAMLSFESP